MVPWHWSYRGVLGRKLYSSAKGANSNLSAISPAPPCKSLQDHLHLLFQVSTQNQPSQSSLGDSRCLPTSSITNFLVSLKYIICLQLLHSVYFCAGRLLSFSYCLLICFPLQDTSSITVDFFFLLRYLSYTQHLNQHLNREKLLKKQKAKPQSHSQGLINQAAKSFTHLQKLKMTQNTILVANLDGQFEGIKTLKNN